LSDLSSLATLWVHLPLLLYPGGQGYKEGNRVGYNMIPIRTLSLLAYFTNIAIYALGSTPWSSGIFWMVVGRIVLDPLLGPSESMWDGSMSTNPRQQPPSDW
jgi:hypothetical protein